VPPKDLCFKSVGNETYQNQDLILRTITKGHDNDYFQSRSFGKILFRVSLLILPKIACWGGTKNEGLG